MTLLYKLLSYLPSRLPIGMAEFEQWADSVIDLLPTGFEQVPRDDKHWVLASAIQHLPSTASRVPKNYFVRLLHKGAASQIAAQVFQNVKLKRDAEIKAKQEADLQAQTAPSTPEATPSVASDVKT